jgi:hypothetical protein
VCAIGKLEGKQHGIIRRIGRLTVGPGMVGVDAQVRADLDDIADEPARQVNHVRAQVAQYSERALAIEPPLIAILATVPRQAATNTSPFKLGHYPAAEWWVDSNASCS